MSFVAAAIIAGGAAAVGAGTKVGAGMAAANKQRQQGRIQSANQGLNNAIYQDVYGKQVQPLLNQSLEQRGNLTNEYLRGLDKTEDRLNTQLTMYQNLSQQGMPEEEKRMLMDAANQAAANSVAQAGSARGSLLGAMNANQSLTDTYRQIASESARIRQQNMMQYAQAQGSYANAIQGLQDSRTQAMMQYQNMWDETFIYPVQNMMNMSLGSAQKGADIRYGAEQAALGTSNSAWQSAGDGISQGGAAVGKIMGM